MRADAATGRVRETEGEDEEPRTPHARGFPWGERFDFSLCVGRYSRADRLYGEAGGFAPGDESPCGVRDLGGSRWEWIGDEYQLGSGTRPLRGGSLGLTGAADSRSAARGGDVPLGVGTDNGFRLVVRPRP